MNFGARLPEPCPLVSLTDGTVFLTGMVRAAPGGATDEQYQRFVAMLADSAASYELWRHTEGLSRLDERHAASTEGTDADCSSPLPN